jgi:hypothetical protein
MAAEKIRNEKKYINHIGLETELRLVELRNYT